MKQATKHLLVAAAALGLTACGSDLFPAESNPMTTVAPITDMGVAIQSVYGTITWITIVIGVLVLALSAYVLVVYRDKGQTENPEQVHGNPTLEIGWTLAPVVIVVMILVPTVTTIFELGDAAPEDKVEVKVIGKRWWWEFRYVPDGDMIKEEIVTANQIHLPANKTASFLITSDSVIHSFWVPRLGGKRDAVPGRTNRMWWTMMPPCSTVEGGIEGQTCTDTQPKDGEPLHFYGECAEFCGEQHAQMKFDVYVDTEGDFRKWADNMLNPKAPEDEKALQGKALFNELGCTACHAITGHQGAVSAKAPNLTNFGERPRIAAGVVENTHENLVAWIRNPDEIKHGSTKRANISRGPRGADDGMNVAPIAGKSDDTDEDGYPNFSEEDLDKLATYLRALK